MAKAILTPGIGEILTPMPFWRSSLEKLSRNVVFRRKLPKRVGGRRIFVSPGAHSLRAWFKADIDPELYDACLDLVSPGAVVWDVGANIGLFSFAAAWRAGRTGSVAAIEPDLFSVSLLRRSARAAGPDEAPVNVIPVAISGSVTLARFHIARRNRSSNFLEGFGQTQANGTREVHLMPAVTLDWLAAELGTDPDVVKIDVEGADREVLRGGERLIRRARPKLLIEVPGESAEWTTGFLLRHGYQLFDADAPKARRRPLPRTAWNTIALPPAATGS